MTSASCTKFQTSNGSVMEPSSNSGGTTSTSSVTSVTLRSDQQGEMLQMFSIIVGQSRTPAPELPLTGQLSQLAGTPTQYFLPNNLDVAAMKDNLVVPVGHILTGYFPPRWS